MKHFLALIITFLFGITSFGQTIIQMEESGGVYKIPCLINGAKMKMVFDTGASNVSLSENMANYLLENDYLTNNDFIGKGESTTANGDVVNHVSVNLKDIEIAGLHLHNVVAVVIEGQNAPLLLGQSAIGKLGPIEINGNKLIIKNNDSMLSGEEMEKLFSQAEEYEHDGLDDKAFEIYSRLYNIDALNDYGKYKYAYNCMSIGKYKNAYDIAKEIKDYSYFDKEGINIYFLLGWISDNNNQNKEAIAFYKKAFDFPTEDYQGKSMDAYSIATVYQKLNDHSNAVKNFSMSLHCLELKNNLRQGYLLDDCTGKLKKKEKSYRTDLIDEIVYQLFSESHEEGTISNENWLYYIAKLAQNGNKHARKTFNNANINWEDYLETY